MKLNRWVQRYLNCGRKRAREIIAAGRVELDGQVERDGHALIGKFTTILVDGAVCQECVAIYVMLHKPAGVVSATEDEEHETVMSLLPPEWEGELHLAGRLDKETTGLLILTNDGRFSRQITEPEEAVGKCYEVATRDVIDAGTEEVFRQGVYLAYEDVTTSPADIEILDERRAKLTIYEGAYHQVKRMFHAVGNRVLSLHRESIGPVKLGDLPEGEWRYLTLVERESLTK